MKLAIGSFKRDYKKYGYETVDVHQWGDVTFVTPAHDLLMIQNCSVETIYASHILNYYDWNEIETMVLPEWFRVLKGGGELRLSVPDFEVISRLYLAGLPLDWFIGPLYGRMETEKNYFIYHKSILDFKKLSSFLSNAGFINIDKFDWKKTDLKDLDDFSQAYIPHMQKDKGILLSLNIRCEKPR